MKKLIHPDQKFQRKIDKLWSLGFGLYEGIAGKYRLTLRVRYRMAKWGKKPCGLFEDQYFWKISKPISEWGPEEHNALFIAIQICKKGGEA